MSFMTATTVYDLSKTMDQVGGPPPAATAATLEKRISTTADIEAAAELNDNELLGHRTTAETLVLCFANLIPPLGVFLSTRQGSKVATAFVLTLLFYLPGLIYAFACMSRRGTGRWSDSPCTLGL